jgi:hypothetical protein
MLQCFNNLPPGAKNILTFDMSAGLTGGNSLTGTPTVTVTVFRGTDPTPDAILNGAATLNAGNTQVLVPVAPTVDAVTYLITVFCNTLNPEIVLDLQWLLPVYSAPSGNWNTNCAPYYNDPAFRAQFPKFAGTTDYPIATLQFAWNMGANWVNQCQTCWGMSPAQTQQAADLMGAVVAYQLFSPASAPGQNGEAPGAVSSATEGSVSATFQLPDIGNSAFSSMLLASPPYGRMLLALLQIAASVGPYIPSGRFGLVPP